MLNKAIKDFVEGLKKYPVWTYQAYHEISVRYKRTFLGSLWISGQYVATSLALSLVFGGIFGTTLRETLPYVMGGILVYGLANFIMTESVEIFMSAGNIIRNNANPFSYYIFEGVCRTFFLFLHNLVVYYLVMLIIGALKVPHWSLVIGTVVVCVAMFSWGTLFAMLAARFRDMRYLLPYLGTILYFMTPIFWHVNQLQGTRSKIAMYNPFYGLLEIMRSPLLGAAPPTHCWTLALAFTATGVVLWFVFFSLFRRRIAFWV